MSLKKQKRLSGPEMNTATLRLIYDYFLKCIVNLNVGILGQIPRIEKEVRQSPQNAENHTRRQR